MCATEPWRGCGDPAHRGVHVITGAEYLQVYRYPDSVSGAHPIDIHGNKSRPDLHFPEERHVPYRA